MAQQERQKTVRLHVGNLSPELVKDITDLEDRFSRYGTIVKPFEIHKKGISGYCFAYITMWMTKKQLQKIRSSFNGVQYKQARISVSVAKPTYKEEWLRSLKRPDDKTSERKKNATLAWKRKERILHVDDNPFEKVYVLKGRMRKTARKIDLRKSTMRVYVNGKMRLSNLRKTKLWGYDKGRTARDLSWEFSNGKWRDGNGHIIERHSRQHILQDPASFEENLAETVQINDESLKTDDGDMDEEIQEEKSRDLNLLESLMGNYNFEKPVEVDNDNSDASINDYELNGVDISSEAEADDHDSYGVTRPKCADNEHKSLVEEYQRQHPEYMAKEEGGSESEEVGERDEMNEENEEKKENKETGEKKENKDNKEKMENENKQMHQDQETDDDKNETEKLRSLLNPETEESGFRFSFGGEAEENSPESEKEEKINEKKEEESIAQPERKKDVGLFFSHSDSPFLSAQSQLSKLKLINVDKDYGYNQWFWDNRGQLNRMFRRRRREAVKRSRRKMKVSRAIL